MGLTILDSFCVVFSVWVFFFHMFIQHTCAWFLQRTSDRLEQELWVAGIESRFSGEQPVLLTPDQSPQPQCTVKFLNKAPNFPVLTLCLLSKGVDCSRASGCYHSFIPVSASTVGAQGLTSKVPWSKSHGLLDGHQAKLQITPDSELPILCVGLISTKPDHSLHWAREAISSSAVRQVKKSALASLQATWGIWGEFMTCHMS